MKFSLSELSCLFDLINVRHKHTLYMAGYNWKCKMKPKNEKPNILSRRKST